MNKIQMNNKAITAMIVLFSMAAGVFAAEFGDLDVKASTLKAAETHVAVPMKPVQNITKSHMQNITDLADQNAAFGSLSVLRSAAQIYYGDHEGVFPGGLEELATPPYLTAIPSIKLPGQKRSDTIINVIKVGSAKTTCDLVTDEGGLIYIADKSAGNLYGEVFLNSSARDLKGKNKYCEY